jgi:hypothetical protein
MKLHGTRVQYGFLLHRNCFLLINVKNFKTIKLKKKNLKNQIFKNFLKFQNFHTISKKFQIDKIFKKFPKFQSSHKISKLE